MSQCCTHILYRAITTPLHLNIIHEMKWARTKLLRLYSHVTPVSMHHQLTLYSTTVSSGCSTTVLWFRIFLCLCVSHSTLRQSSTSRNHQFEGQIPRGLVNELHSVFKVCSYHSCQHDYHVSVLSTLLNYSCLHVLCHASILLACKDARMSISDNHQIPWYLVL